MTRWKATELPAHIRSQLSTESLTSWRNPLSPKGPKYRAKIRWIDHVKFDSELEASHYLALKALQAAGAIRYFLHQVTFRLPGGYRHKVDWLVVVDGHPNIVAESKGYDLPLGRMKRKQVEELYGIEIRLWTQKGRVDLPEIT